MDKKVFHYLIGEVFIIYFLIELSFIYHLHIQNDYKYQKWLVSFSNIYERTDGIRHWLEFNDYVSNVDFCYKQCYSAFWNKLSPVWFN